jgi:hypothetical protein
VTDDEGMFMRLNTNSSEQVHVMALHLEHYSQYGGMALDPEQAQQIAQTLRLIASKADYTAEAYNQVLDKLEDRIREDERYQRIGRRVRHIVTFVVIAAIVLSVIL